MWKTCWLFSFLFPLCLFGQSNQLCIKDIQIIGNKKTKEAIILRELDLKKGDCFPLTELNTVFERNQNQILNSGLFTIVKLNIENWDDSTNQITLSITVRETWYFYPIPIFELADRNFNVWWTEQNRALDRINFGVSLYHTNLTGRRDFLKVITQFGYTQKFEIEYLLPGFNKNQTLGVFTNWFFSRNREIPYQTTGNKLLFDRSEDDFQLRRLRFSAGVQYRPGIFTYQEGSLEFHQNTVTDSVANFLNEDYFLNGKKQQRFFALQYAYIYDNRDIKPYPLSGSYFKANIRKEGLGIFDDRSTLTLSATLAKYFKIQRKFSLELITKGNLFFIRKQQAYHNNRALGFEIDFLRGYELYVIDGMDFAYLKSSVRYELFNKHINFGKLMMLEKFRIMPLRIYLSLNSDWGIANNKFYNQNNPLDNRLLWGGGLGLDIITYYDKILQIQYSVNHLWEKGLYLHYKLIF